MTTNWTIAVDWARSGSFTDTNDDITAYVQRAEWFLGMKESFGDIADNSVLELELNNSDRRFSPEYGSSPLYGNLAPFRPVRIQSNDGTTVHTHWVGWIDSIQPAVNQYGEQVAHIVAKGPGQFFQAAETTLELQEHQRTDEIIAALIKEVVIPPALPRACIIGKVGNAEIGQTTYLADTTAYSDLETGKTTLAIAADNWVQRGGMNDDTQDTFNVYRAIRDVTAAERGRFFFDREGKAIFWNRHHLLDDNTLTVTFNDTMTDLDYRYAGTDDFRNEIQVTCHPRSVGASADQILWELESEVHIPAGETQKVYVKYRDDSDNRIGAKDVTLIDVEFSDGSASITFDIQATGGVLIINNNGATEAVLSAAKITGRKITDFGRMEAQAIDRLSIVQYGRRVMNLNLPSVDNFNDAQSIATFEVQRRAEPRGTVQALTVKSHGQDGGGQHTHQLALTIGDLITIQETQTDHDAAYAIIGEAHELTSGATLFKTTWYLEPVPEQYPGKIGDTDRGKLGQTTYITY